MDNQKRTTKDELQTMTDDQLLDMADRAKGHTKDFQDYMTCDFSYSFLTDTLQKRGYVNGWYKPATVSRIECAETVILRSQEPGKRLTLTVDPAVAEEWHEVASSVRHQQALATVALSRLIRAAKDGKIKFEIGL